MARTTVAAVAAALFAVANGQQIGTTPEVHPNLTTSICTTDGGCTDQATSVVIDWGYHWLHTINGSTSCTTSDQCDTDEDCYNNCEIEGANYTALGVTTSGSSMTLQHYVMSDGELTASSPRVYLLAPDGENYEMLQLNGQEISYDVDVSGLPCGENGALYLSEMSETGGRSATNPGGAAYGSGYCDAQCGVNSFFNGSVNTAGVGGCCQEMDLWEANSEATALTPHPCDTVGPYGCTGSTCSSVCDKSGCGFNPYAMGDTSYYVPGGTVDTTQPFTVTTQFITDDNTTTGTLVEIRRSYIQNGVVIPNAVATSSSGWSGLDSITEAYCTSSDSSAASLGALTTMGEALARGMVLAFSIWNDAGGYMNWLDSGSAGPCNSTEGNPTIIESEYPDTSVTFSNIKWGDIGSTTST